MDGRCVYVHGWMDRWVDGWQMYVCPWMNGWMDRYERVDGWIYGRCVCPWMDGLMDVMDCQIWMKWNDKFIGSLLLHTATQSTDP